jgi:hypothetical protein
MASLLSIHVFAHIRNETIPKVFVLQRFNDAQLSIYNCNETEEVVVGI